MPIASPIPAGYLTVPNGDLVVSTGGSERARFAANGSVGLVVKKGTGSGKYSGTLEGPLHIGTADTDDSYLNFIGNSTVSNVNGYVWQMGLDVANSPARADFFLARASGPVGVTPSGVTADSTIDYFYIKHGGTDGPSTGLGRTSPNLGNANLELQLMSPGHNVAYDTLRLWGLTTQTGDILSIRKQDGTRIFGAYRNTGALYFGELNNSTLDLFAMRSGVQTLRISRDSAGTNGAIVSAAKYVCTEDGSGIGFVYNPATGTGGAFKSIVGADANEKFSIRYDGMLAWGAGGGSGTNVTLQWDTLGRRLLASHQFSAQGIATLHKSGTVSDADFSVTPLNGTIAIDSSGSLLWARVGGVWKSVALA